MSKTLDGEYDVEKTLCLRIEDGEEPSRYHLGNNCIVDHDWNIMTQQNETGRVRNRIYRLLKPDWAFACILVIGLVLILLEAGNSPEVVSASWTAFSVAAAAIGLATTIVLLATMIAALDRRHTDDYHFQIISNAAVTAIIASVFVNLIWSVVHPVLGSMSVELFISIILFCWGLAYFFYRWRGLS